MFGFDDFGLAWLCVVDIWDLWMFATRFGSMDTGAICLLVPPDDQYACQPEWLGLDMAPLNSPAFCMRPQGGVYQSNPS